MPSTCSRQYTAGDLDMRLSEWLIRRSTVSVSRTRIPTMLHTRTLLRWESRARNTLIRIRCLLDTDLLVRALAAAAANAQEPKESRCETESEGEPDDRQHLAAHGGLDVVGLEHRFEDACENGVDGSRSCGGGKDKDCLCLETN